MVCPPGQVHVWAARSMVNAVLGNRPWFVHSTVCVSHSSSLDCHTLGSRRGLLGSNDQKLNESPTARKKGDRFDGPENSLPMPTSPTICGVSW